MEPMTVDATLPEIPIYVYEFVFDALGDLEVPAMPGALWHSVFGLALHNQSCIKPGMKCEGCLLLHQCDYPYLFRRIAPPDSEMMAEREVPVPHVFVSEYSLKCV